MKQIMPYCLISIPRCYEKKEKKKKTTTYLVFAQKHRTFPIFDGRLRVTMIIMRCGRHVTDDINDQGTASDLLQVQSSCP